MNGSKVQDAPRSAPAARRLYDRHELPAWYTNNSFVLHGYRPITPNIAHCFQSWGFVHNESVNIYTHLVPAIIALLANLSLHLYLQAQYPKASATDRMIFHIYITTSLLCFGMSTCYHTLLCHSERFASLWLRIDFAGITVQILGSFISGIYMGFYCEPDMRRLHWSIIGGLSLLTATIVLSPRQDTKKWRTVRLFAFVATGLSAFAPIIHGAMIFPYDQLDKQAGLRYYYIEGVAMIAGVYFYASHFPESWRPGKFDIWGSSHQIFHVLVVIGSTVHFCGILDAYEWNYRNQRCLWPAQGMDEPI